MAPPRKPHRMTGDDWIACGVFLFATTVILLACLLAAAVVESLIMRKLLGPPICVCAPAEGG